MSPQTVGSRNPVDAIRNLDTIHCGKDAAKHFLHDATYVNLNHGKEIQAVQRYFQDKAEARPDSFVRYQYRTELLEEARSAIAEYLNVPTECCVYVPNASTGIDIVLHNLNYKPGDVIIGFANIYDSNEYTAQYLTETTPVEFQKIQYTYPISDQAICDAFEDTIQALARAGKTPKIAVFDTITSLPAFRMPFERLTKMCRSRGILSLIDGAHGIGMLPLQVRELDADFFVSNLHKWLYTPRGCALMYVPVRNQHLLKVTFPTGYGFLPFPKEEEARKGVPNNFVSNFADIGTRDETPYLCVAAALEWRSKIVWQEKRGEDAIMAYLYHVAEQGGLMVAATLGTEVLAQGQTSMTNVRLPLSMNTLAGGVSSNATEVGKWIMKEMMMKHDTAVNITYYAGALWVRLSAQVYLTLQDFETAAVNLKAHCEAASERTWTFAS